MIRSLEIKGYRRFESFEMEDLGRVNLLVGTNNCGKTAILESIHLLSSLGSPEALWSCMSRRGERLTEDQEGHTGRSELEACHLFTGHNIEPGTEFRIIADTQGSATSIQYQVAEYETKEEEGPPLLGELFEDEESPLPSRLVIRVQGTPPVRPSMFHLSPRGGVSLTAFEGRRRLPTSAPAVEFVSTDSLSAEYVGRRWQHVALTREEEHVLQALRLLEPQIERIAFVGVTPQEFRYRTRGGMVVKCENLDAPIPIGSMGEGMWRMLAIALSIARSENGVLLIDEIDTGLHHSVMADLWRMMTRTAERLNVQVFATTHSYDCVHSLAAVCRKDADTTERVSIQRIDPERDKAVAFSERDIVMAAERQIEVR